MLLSTLLYLGARAQTTSLLSAPSQAVHAGTEIILEWVVLNSSDRPATYSAPNDFEAVYSTALGSWTGRFQRAAEAATTVPAGGFVRIAYTSAVPRGPVGDVVLTVSEAFGTPARTVLRVISTPYSAAASPALAKTENKVFPTSPADRVASQRVFGGRFAAHDPVYFIYGADSPGAKFQFSFKYRLLSVRHDNDGPSQANGSRIQFGYTQRSLWDIDAESSPFYDTSYIPALFYELAASPRRDDGGLNWLGFQSGFQHESNGRDGMDSRSLNTLFLRTGLVAGRLDGWHLTASLRVHGYVGGLSDNRDLDDYRGYGDWSATVAHGEGVRLAYTGRAGKDFNRFTTQLDLTVPLELRLLDFATFFLVQYFYGYGESLRSYDVKSETIRAGFSFVR